MGSSGIPAGPVPKLGDLLADIDQAEEEIESSRNAFFDLAIGSEMMLSQEPKRQSKEELELQTELQHHFGKFSYGNFKAMGDAIMAESRRLLEEQQGDYNTTASGSATDTDTG